MEVKWELKMRSEVKLMAMVETLLMVAEVETLLVVAGVEILLVVEVTVFSSFLEVVGVFSSYLEVVVIEAAAAAAAVFLDEEVLMAEIESFYDYMVMVGLRDHEVA
jgi:uncharacterized membrane protein